MALQTTFRRTRPRQFRTVIDIHPSPLLRCNSSSKHQATHPPNALKHANAIRRRHDDAMEHVGTPCPAPTLPRHAEPYSRTLKSPASYPLAWPVDSFSSPAVEVLELRTLVLPTRLPTR
uniref:Uncharacterized protein n=1 Tax=Mycena chlorophos TaxID=658473 RepID=A0ABQ0L7M1_MYCCL|nr:predicted protein [Mycena chlorophos]